MNLNIGNVQSQGQLNSNCAGNMCLMPLADAANELVNVGGKRNNLAPVYALSSIADSQGREKRRGAQTNHDSDLTSSCL